MALMIPIELKKQCVERKVKGEKPSDIYAFFIANCDSEMNFNSFRRKLNQWKKHSKISEDVLFGASLSGNIKPTWGTVEVNGDGKVTRAWLRGDGQEQWQEQILEAIKNVKPLETVIDRSTKVNKTMLEIPLFDMHFGVNTFEDYKNHLGKIVKRIRTGHEHILITVGSDLLHHNDMRSNTASGTPIEQINVRQAWQDALKFYRHLINESIQCSKKVTVIYVKGNHDESLSWALVQLLKQLFPTIIVEDSFKERKLFTWEKIFIGYIHGDKPINDIDRAFIRENKKAYANAEIVEIHIGHTHKEVVKGNVQDLKGTMVRVLSTSAKTDKWHDDHNYIGANKRFQLFEYSNDELIGDHYISGK